MKQAVWTGWLWVVGLGVVAAATPKDPTPELLKQVDAMKPALVETRRHFHAHPELSNREVETGKELARRLTAMGYAVQTGVAGHGVTATLQGGQPGPLVAWRTDIDALPVTEAVDSPFKSQNPGVMHACGHDVHMTVALGVAQLLMKNRATIPGSVKFIFQPAEEGPPAGEEGGASLMIKQGVLEPRPVAILGLHTAPDLKVGDVATVAGPLMAAADRFRLTVRGKGAHGAQPHNGVDAVYVGSQVVGALQSVVSRRNDARRPLVVTVGSFHAGTRFNILAEEATLEGTVRTLDPQSHAAAPKEMSKIVDGICSAHGATCTFENTVLAPVLVNDPALYALAQTTLDRTLGRDHVKTATPMMIAEDFGFYAQQVPALFLMLGVGNPDKGITAGLHSPNYQADEEALAVGVRVASSLIVARLRAR